MKPTSEAAFETVIESHLLDNGYVPIASEGFDHSWRHSKIILKPANPDFEPIILTSAEEGSLQVIAEVIEVLGGGR